MLKILLSVLFFLAAVQDLHAAKRIGVIMTGDIPYYEKIHDTFVTELNKKFTGSEEIEIIPPAVISGNLSYWRPSWTTRAGNVGSVKPANR